MKKWEHEYDSCGSSEILKLNMESRSRDGWELVTVTETPAKHPISQWWYLFWKRPVESP